MKVVSLLCLFVWYGFVIGFVLSYIFFRHVLVFIAHPRFRVMCSVFGLFFGLFGCF